MVPKRTVATCGTLARKGAAMTLRTCTWSSDASSKVCANGAKSPTGSAMVSSMPGSKAPMERARAMRRSLRVSRPTRTVCVPPSAFSYSTTGKQLRPRSNRSCAAAAALIFGVTLMAARCIYSDTRCSCQGRCNKSLELCDPRAAARSISCEVNSPSNKRKEDGDVSSASLALCAVRTRTTGR